MRFLIFSVILLVNIPFAYATTFIDGLTFLSYTNILSNYTTQVSEAYHEYPWYTYRDSDILTESIQTTTDLKTLYISTHTNAYKFYEKFLYWQTDTDYVVNGPTSFETTTDSTPFSIINKDITLYGGNFGTKKIGSCSDDVFWAADGQSLVTVRTTDHSQIDKYSYGSVTFQSTSGKKKLELIINIDVTIDGLSIPPSLLAPVQPFDPAKFHLSIITGDDLEVTPEPLPTITSFTGSSKVATNRYYNCDRSIYSMFSTYKSILRLQYKVKFTPKITDKFTMRLTSDYGYTTFDILSIVATPDESAFPVWNYPAWSVSESISNMFIQKYTDLFTFKSPLSEIVLPLNPDDSILYYSYDNIDYTFDFSTYSSFFIFIKLLSVGVASAFSVKIISKAWGY